jgi:hydroquinone glucosyltransferase
VVKLLMDDDGNGIRGRIEELRDDAVDALKEDGSSKRAICQFGETLERFVNNM